MGCLFGGLLGGAILMLAGYTLFSAMLPYLIGAFLIGAIYQIVIAIASRQQR